MMLCISLVISSSGVIHLGMSDHSLVYAVRKVLLPKSKLIVREVRNLKHFSETDFRADLLQVPWGIIQYFNDSNECWRVSKSLFHGILDKHAPLRQKWIKANSVSWITPDVKRLMRNIDYHKKKAIKCASQYHWPTQAKMLSPWWFCKVPESLAIKPVCFPAKTI